MRGVTKLTLKVVAGVTALLAWASVTSPVVAQEVEKKDITVFAAASLKTALDAVTASYMKATGSKVIISYAASSALAKQIEQLAPADIFVSADLEWMNYISQKGLIKDDTRVDLLGNRLVLVAPAESSASIKIAKDFALADAIGNGKLAMGEVKSVPAGKYGRAALDKLGVWAAVEPKVAQMENVRAALALVARGEAGFGIVYQTDAFAEPKVKIVDIFPEDTHPPIVYPFAALALARDSQAANAFLTYLQSAEAKSRFEKEGFKVLSK
ncbi:MAG: molybdate ABC transporter substrate-binding protein [Hyphomicrobium sp.]|nr:molybdate ABC transporter substrate-binding protein [Hyphomicrobium sp.]